MYQKDLLDIRKADVAGKRVFLRADLDAPFSENGQIENDLRLASSKETIEYLLSHHATVIIGSKLGRPEGKVVPALSLWPVAKWMAQEFGVRSPESGVKKTTIGEFEGWEINEHLFLLENLRFYKEEEENDPNFAKKLASLADIYVNDAFAMAHRRDASVIAVPALLPHFAGLRLQKEVETLTDILENPRRPLVIVIGGKKIETKLPLVAKLCQFADYVLVGGKIAQEKAGLEKLLIQLAAEKKTKATLLVADANDATTDITEKSIAAFNAVIATAATIVWNGPVGQTNQGDESKKGTRAIAQKIANTTAYKVVGGGDTVKFLQQEKLLDKFDFVSTGGGAMLAFLSGEKLPALETLLL